MYNRFVLIVVFVPLAIILVALAVANRGLVDFTLDPFNPGNPALTLKLPLFVYLFLAIAARPGRRQRRDLDQAGPLPQAGAPACAGSAGAARCVARRAACFGRASQADGLTALLRLLSGAPARAC